jgi:steroid delta-isomerase-like uncharacterized protein
VSDPARPLHEVYSALARGDPEAAAEHVSEDFVFEDVALGRTEGRAQAVERWKSLLRAFPHISFRVDREVVAGETVIQEQFVQGRHEGGFLDIPASGATVRFRSVVVAQCRDDRVSWLRLYRDVSGFTAQFAFMVQAARVAAVLNRALPISLIVGTIFTLLNQLPKMLAGSMVTADYIRLVVNYLVPFTVATTSALIFRPPKPGRIPGGLFGRIFRRRIAKSIREEAAENEEERLDQTGGQP